MLKVSTLLITLSFISFSFGQKKFKIVAPGTIDASSYYHGVEEDISKSSPFKSFEASALVTWKDYKLFLFETKRTKGEYYFNLFSPKLPNEILQKGLSTNKIDKEPVTGVSHTAVLEYCKWKTIYDSKYVFEFSYRLPSLQEWMILNRDFKKQIDINKGVAEWTSTAKDESLSSIGFDFSNYQYQAKETEPPAMKRKVVMGNSFRLNCTKPIDFSTIDYYQDSSYSNVGFRIIKVKTDNFNPAWSDWLCDYVDKFDPWIFGKKTVLTTEDGGNIVYYENAGAVCGMITSYYPNGSPRSSGFLYNNMRLGTWTIYNQSGEKLQERVYTGLNSFRVTYPKLKGETESKLRDSMQFFSSRDADGLLVYPFIKEGYISQTQRILSTLDKGANFEAFYDTGLTQVLEDAFLKNEVKCYDTIKQWFKDELTQDEFKKRMKGEVIRYEIVSDFFFDLERNCAENRILGLSPIVYDSATQKEIQIGWFYYPQIRSLLRQSNITDGLNNSKTVPLSCAERLVPYNFDDLFMNGDYNAEIKTIFSHEKEMGSMKNKSLIFYLIETEHDWWKELSGH